ncbi:MAG: MutS-related protein [Acidobacteriota bacterium]
MTSRTAAGEARLATWLTQPATPDAIRERQQAVAELAPRLDLQEELAILGPEVDTAVDTGALEAWANAPQFLGARWPRIALPLLAAATTGLVGRWIWTGEPPDWLLPALVVQGLVALAFRRGVRHVVHGVERREQELRVLATLIDRLERETVESELLQRLRAQLRATGRSPADEVRRLAWLVELLSSGHNQIFAPISALLLLGTQLAFAVEAWRARSGPAVSRWLSAVAEYEALCALATYAAEHPHHPFAELVDGDARLEGEQLTHPLLPAASAVANDVRLGGDGPRLVLVSGSNMSGKSTWLRTIGLNAVLAQAGAPVSARRLRMTPLAAGATLRVQDSLHAGRSRFFTEISRIAALVTLTRAPGARVLCLFDELLSGTNSHDRLQGATGILAGLLAKGAIVVVTTHDLALTAMVDRFGGAAANLHFEDRFEDGRLTFDYQLKPGIVRSSNGLALMRAVGLDV